MYVVYFSDVVRRSKYITGMPLSYALSMTAVRFVAEFGATISRSTFRLMKSFICPICFSSLSSAERKLSSMLSVM